MNATKKCMKTYCAAQAKRQTRKHGGRLRDNLADCKLLWCNPTCKKTGFGSALTLSKTLRSQPRYKKGAVWRAEFEKKRRRLFGTRKNILDKGFYAKIPAAMKKSLRDQGAISGCHE